MRLVDADAEVERLKKDYCEECTRKGNYGIFGAACTPCWVMDSAEEFENAPTIAAEPVGYWIPCGERLPEKDTSVLIFAAGHRVTAYYDAVKGAFRLTESTDLFYWASAVTHWMPLPEPPLNIERSAKDG